MGLRRTQKDAQKVLKEYYESLKREDLLEEIERTKNKLKIMLRIAREKNGLI